MHVLPLYKIESVDKLVWPVAPTRITTQSSALTIFTDFKEHMPLVIDSATQAVELERLMKQSHVKMKIVLDHSGQFAGIVTLNDLSEQRIMQKVAHGATRSELKAIDFMQPKSMLQSFDYAQLSRSTVGDIVETLKDSGQHHCLVVDREAHEIRGIVSVSDIARLLRVPLDIQLQPSFSALSKVIAA
ncbi:CBS domain-containing protein [Alteromonas pelagimontana]|uniref:CBS domain-containing protein n=1 Tax=Alteromonas pelagimontana TaxID=1858656 RepID=A0A6M4MDH4_9ALTE|nr:CBS domain-containing protein [Alteromonas pelagimontana]QJR80680.1 CBS domain-containing protein [Alteromonas pelagimontana]